MLERAVARALSPKFVEVVFEQLLSLRNEGLTVVMVEQESLRMRCRSSDRGYVMHLGQVATQGRRRNCSPMTTSSGCSSVKSPKA